MPQLPSSIDVLVVGAGPAGSSAAFWSARTGRSVVLADAAVFPRDKTCGDGLTPRAIAELDDLGLGDWVRSRSVSRGIRAVGFGREALIPWPERHWPAMGSVVPRTELDARLRDHAAEAGAISVDGVRAVSVVQAGNAVTAVEFDTPEGRRTVRCRSLIVADGVRSPLGKMLGRQWHRVTAFGVSGRAYIESDLATDDWITFDLEPRDPAGNVLRGYGWMFPTGDSGLVNLGVFLIATKKHPVGASLRPIVANYAEHNRDRWKLRGTLQHQASALLPMGGAVSGIAGGNWLIVGDAAGLVNPLNGEGIDYALETGRLGAEQLSADDLSESWPALLRQRYGGAYSLARRVAPRVYSPRVLRAAAPRVFASPALADRAFRVMGNFVEPSDRDRTARTWRALGALSARVDRQPLFEPMS
ncbi:geranylgeranyl reductase family protein [Smaragdicoccus niigatensis]|uniref:geranylgeranyl reductase family protein n=1 Tax=Smaragdicoccus niigatensis TaxID=359359 RepID=UPI000475DC84|nr:geranylgeranyl reductase family protein [Smaragdicoccus niigatensis]